MAQPLVGTLVEPYTHRRYPRTRRDLLGGQSEEMPVNIGQGDDIHEPNAQHVRLVPAAQNSAVRQEEMIVNTKNEIRGKDAHLSESTRPHSL